MASIAAQPSEGATLASPAGEAALAADIAQEQVSMLFRQLPMSVALQMAGATLLLAALRGQVSEPALITWFFLVTTTQLSRILLFTRYERRKIPRAEVVRWGRLWAIGSGISGVLWGATAIAFFTPHSELYQAIVAILVYGVAAGAVPLIASHAASFYALVVPALTPFAVRYLIVGDGPHIALGIILAAVAFAILSFGRSYNRLLVSALHSRFRNEAMARELAGQNAQLAAARALAEQASRVKTQFFAAASHDLRQPLHAMGLFAAALEEKVRDPGVRRVVESINSSVQALEGLFNELLDFSQTDAGAIRPQLSHFSLDAGFRRLADEFGAEARAKGLQLLIHGEAPVVFSDAVLLERILRNLLSNAVRYTLAGRISLSASGTPDGLVRIAVRDTGIGIRPEDQSRIFDEFVQLANSGRTSKKGLGLGLVIVKRLCDLLGYRITLESECGMGSTFWLDVPMGAAALHEEAPPEERRRTDLSGKLIVVVDDEESIVNGMSVLLRGWGAEVIGSLTGEDVLEAVHRNEQLPDLIIADYRLAGTAAGTDVIARLREALDPEIAAVLVTGSTGLETIAEAVKREFAILLKPVLPDRLRQVIEERLRMD